MVFSTSVLQSLSLYKYVTNYPPNSDDHWPFHVLRKSYVTLLRGFLTKSFREELQ